MRFFTYGRKSVYKDSSDSIDNQMRMCREYCEARFSGEIDSWQQFSDEDFTGANTNRPGFQQMMQEIRDGMCDVLVVYQLDRFSRDVRDFSQAYSEMQAHHVRFICLDLNIDTSTPIGEAMMYVSAAFGQMERKNIALRVADNMIGLAKKGYWVGGNPPIGYERSRITVDGRKHVTIVPVPEGVEYINWLFDYWNSGDYTLQGLESEFKRSGVKTYYGNFFSTTQLHQLLTSPYCCAATEEVYDYYEGLGCKIESPRELWDGSHGVMVYGRTTEKDGVHRKAPASEWTVCIGYHVPIMSADKWLKAQSKMTHKKCYIPAKYPVALLKGTLKCSCGTTMAVSTKRKPLGGYSRWYYCNKRMRQGVEACPMGQTKCNILDDKVLEIFNQIKADPKLINEYAENPGTNKSDDPKKYEKKISQLEDKIGRLAASLALAANSAASKYIIAEMEDLDGKLNDLKAKKDEAERIRKSEVKKNKNSAETAAEITKLIENMDNFTPEERNQIVKSIVKKLVWDGETLFISL